MSHMGTTSGNARGDVKAALAARGREVEAYLAGCCHDSDIPERLAKAMRYSLEAGGKRLRPALFLSCASLCGLAARDVMPFAAAIEMIHTYSLIHDDLPAMDNDDLRRGKPSNHKAFDEATAILAGDGLLTDAFGIMCRTVAPAASLLTAIAELAHAAGSAGMVGGQELDMLYTGRPGLELATLQHMHALKTGALIGASCVCGAILANADSEIRGDIAEYGRALGMAFQIADDILDEVSDAATLGKPAGSDREKGKNTYPALVGLEASRQLAQAQAARAREALAAFSGPEADFLRDLAEFTVTRVC